MNDRLVLLLDVDGVLADFVSSACRLCGHDPAEVYSRWTPGDYAFEKLLGMTRNDFYGAIDRAGADFWENLEILPHAKELWQFCRSRADAYFCSTPTRDAGSLPGKRAWLAKHFGRDAPASTVFTEHKWLLSHPHTLLVDDRDSNVESFRDRKPWGGHAILFPTISNERHAERNDAFEIVKKEIEAWTS